MNTERHRPLYVIEVAGVTPRTKAAATEAIKHAPDSVLLIDEYTEPRNRPIDRTGANRLRALLATPYQRASFTDGKGAYFGEVIMAPDRTFYVE